MFAAATITKRSAIQPPRYKHSGLKQLSGSINQLCRASKGHADEVQFTLLGDLAAFDSITGEWNSLHNSNQVNQNCFQSHAWLRSWLIAYNQGNETRSSTTAIILVRNQHRLLLACPFAVRNVLGMTHLTWLGEPASQYGDILSDGTATSLEYLGDAMDFAITHVQPDLIHLRKVREDAAIIPWLRKNRAAVTTSDEAPYMDLRGVMSFETYCDKFSGKSRKNRRRLRRRLEEDGTITTRVLTPGKYACEAIRTGLEFKQRWLVERGHVSSALRDDHMSDFLTHFVSSPAPMGKPFVSIMHSAETPVSVQFGIISKRRLALHMIAYNPETEKSGAGILHIEDTLKHCIQSNIEELDFLAPNAAYKQVWSDDITSLSDYVIARTIKGQIYSQGYLCRARDVLKAQVATLPLPVRQNIAKHLQK